MVAPLSLRLGQTGHPGEKLLLFLRTYLNVLFRTSFFVFLVSLFRKLEDDMSKKYTLADFCKKRGITPEWLASIDGHLEIDSRTRRLRDD